jgi:hypothetical protein
MQIITTAAQEACEIIHICPSVSNYALGCDTVPHITERFISDLDQRATRRASQSAGVPARRRRRAERAI